MANVALDEQRHIGFGVKLLSDLARRGPRGPRRRGGAAARDVPLQRRRVRAAGLGPPLQRVLRLHDRGDLRRGHAVDGDEDAHCRHAARAAARASRSASTCRWRSACGGRSCCSRPGCWGSRTARRRAIPRCSSCCSTPCAPPWTRVTRTGTTVRRSSGTSRTSSRGTCAWRTGTRASRAVALRTRTWTLRCAYADWVDVMAGRADPRLQMLKGKLRPRGNPLALWRMQKLFGR